MLNIRIVVKKISLFGQDYINISLYIQAWLIMAWLILHKKVVMSCRCTFGHSGQLTYTHFMWNYWPPGFVFFTRNTKSGVLVCIFPRKLH